MNDKPLQNQISINLQDTKTISIFSTCNMTNQILIFSVACDVVFW